MGYYYGYGGIPVPYGKDKLRAEWRKAEEWLASYDKAISSPIGSFAREEVMESNITREALEADVRRTKEAYENCMKLYYRLYDAEERLKAYKESLSSPIDSSARKDTMNSNETLWALEADVRRAREAYENCFKK